MSERRAAEVPGSPTGAALAEPAEALLFLLEERYSRLCEEVAALESRLRELRTAADLCPQCGGTGLRWVRGGLYGEIQQRPCPCAQERGAGAPAAAAAPRGPLSRSVGAE